MKFLLSSLLLPFCRRSPVVLRPGKVARRWSAQLWSDGWAHFFTATGVCFGLRTMVEVRACDGVFSAYNVLASAPRAACFLGCVPFAVECAPLAVPFAVVCFFWGVCRLQSSAPHWWPVS